MDTFLRVVLAACEDVGTPRALAVHLLVTHGEWAQLAMLRMDPSLYQGSEDYFRDALVTELLRKCDLPSGIDRERKARDTFLECELINCRTNVRLSRYFEPLFLEEQEVAVYRFICDWRKEVRLIMGSLPTSMTPRFSGGATYADVGTLTTIPDKMSSRPTVYQHSRDVTLPFWGETSWGRSVVTHRSDSDPRRVRGNIFFTVPKDAKSFRGCCKEASLNVSFQLDLGRLLKTRLKERAHIDLRDGQITHQEAARAASADGSHTTIDLSNASDTLCLNLVKLLLPEPWYEVLSSLRANFTRVGTRWHKLEKFSSMGNGFTFELESLLFVTLARVLYAKHGLEGNPLCYGDDLIVSKEIHHDLVAALKYFGFTPNERKTFAEGPFRESCGGDFFDGVPVRAHYVKKPPDEPQQWIALANGLRRVCDPITYPQRWKYVTRAWHLAQRALPVSIYHCRGPSHLGDVVIHDEESRWRYVSPPKGHDPSWSQKYVHSYQPIPIVLDWRNWKAGVQLACCTLGLQSDGVTPRGGVAGYRQRKVGVSLTNHWLPS
jgi:hypothetical protein